MVKLLRKQEHDGWRVSFVTTWGGRERSGFVESELGERDFRKTRFRSGSAAHSCDPGMIDILQIQVIAKS